MEGKGSWIGLGALAGLLALVALAAYHKGEFGPEKAWEEAFGASLEVFGEAVLVGGIALIYSRRVTRREETERLTREVREIHSKVRQASIFMKAHMSGKTWTEQLRSLIAERTRLDDIILQIESQRRYDEVRSRLQNALTLFRDLEQEYVTEHDQVDKKTSLFMGEKKQHPEKADSAQFWSDLLTRLPKTTELLIVEGCGPLFDQLRAALKILEKMGKLPTLPGFSGMKE
jgi:hypothetical protein